MLHFTPSTTSSTTSSSPKALEENMQNVLKSTEDIINDDFEKLKLSPFQDFSWSPQQASNPTVYASSHERRPFDPLSQYPVFQHSNLTSRFSPTHGSPKEITPFVATDVRETEYSNRPREDSTTNSSRSVTEFIRRFGANSGTNPVLKLSVVGQSQYVLEEKDIISLFSPFGRILNFLITKPRTAYIVFYDMNTAFNAQKGLNKRYLKDYNVNVYVNFCLNVEEDIAIFDSPNPLQLQKYQVSNGSDKENACLPKNANKRNTVFTFNQETPFLPNFTAKFTCKYEVQIQNEKEFRVAQKIIGSRGYNMKKIIEVCQNQVKNQNIISKADFLKLRLRGKGSGFKEGPDQKESEEPIHLCVSSRYKDVFETACRLVEELLNYVYREYEVFCKATGRKGGFPLQIKKSETFCSPNSDRQGSESAASTPNMSSPHDFGSFQFNNENVNTFQDGCFAAYQSKPSPNGNFGGQVPRRQFGQPRMMNCINEVPVYQQNFVNASYIKYN